MLDFAVFRTVRGRFIVFAIVGSLSTAGAVACFSAAQIAVAGAQPAPAETIAPTQIVLAPDATGRQLLEASARCVDLAHDARVPAWLVSGSLDRATVLIDDPVCSPYVSTGAPSPTAR